MKPDIDPMVRDIQNQNRNTTDLIRKGKNLTRNGISDGWIFKVFSIFR